jgi:hypothetical protein
MKIVAALWHKLSVNTTSPKYIGSWNTWRFLYSVEDLSLVNSIVLQLFNEDWSDRPSGEDRELGLLQSL